LTVDDGSANCESETGCSIDWHNGSAYLFCNSPSRNWISAKNYCASQGYHLAVVNDVNENSFLDENASATSSNRFWIGLCDVDSDGEYEDDEWDGGTSSYRHWNTINGSAGDCAALRTEDGYWGDRSPSESFGFVCESP